MITATRDLTEFFQDELTPKIDWEHWLDSEGLNPQEKSNYIVCDCPGCGEHRCSFFPNIEDGAPRFLCNRKNDCGYDVHVLAYIDKGSGASKDDFPTGKDYVACLERLAKFAGITLSIQTNNYQPSAPQPHLLNDYWEFLKSRFKGSKAEEYITSRGLNPDKNEYGFFPAEMEEILEWAKVNDWTIEDLKAAGLIIKGKNGDYYVFAYSRLAGAFKRRENVFNLWGRDLTGKNEFKYLNLHNSDYAHKKAPYEKGPRSDTVVWVEGYLDTNALSESGYRAASSGTSAIPETMWESLDCKQVLISLDFDQAGRKGALSFLEKHLNDESRSIWFVDPAQMNGCKDFAELYQKHGKEGVDEALDESTWVHRDTVLANLLVELNSKDKDSLTAFECETILEEAHSIDKKVSVGRIPSFGKHFWNPLCNATGYDIDATLDKIENARERQKREKAQQRISKMTSAFQGFLLEGDLKTANELYDDINRELKSLSNNEKTIRTATTPLSREAVKEELDRLGEGIKTGISIGNEEILLTRGGVTTVGAATSHGKTTVMVNLTLNILKLRETSVFFITIEEPISAITSRFINTHCNIKLSNNNNGTIKHWLKNDSEEMFADRKAPEKFLEREKEFWNLIENRSLNIVRGSKSLEETISLIHTAVEHNPDIGCVVVDYLQLLYPNTPSSARHEEIKRICDSLLQTSINLGIAILSAAQFNREVKSMNEVVSTSLGEGGSIERYCDQIIGIWNHSFDDESRNRIGVRILKNRNGVRRKGELLWDGNLGLIENIVVV